MGGKINHTIEEVAESLSHVRSFNGHLGEYTTAQHSCLVSDMLGGSYNGLMHDGHEMICGDLCSPVKTVINHMSRGAWMEFEFSVEKQWRKYWGVAHPIPAQVKKADTLARRVEIACLASNRAKTAFVKLGLEPHYDQQWRVDEVWSCDRAYEEFMKRYEVLNPGRRK